MRRRMGRLIFESDAEELAYVRQQLDSLTDQLDAARRAARVAEERLEERLSESRARTREARREARAWRELYQAQRECTWLFERPDDPFKAAHRLGETLPASSVPVDVVRADADLLTNLDPVPATFRQARLALAAAGFAMSSSRTAAALRYLRGDQPNGPVAYLDQRREEPTP